VNISVPRYFEVLEGEGGLTGAELMTADVENALMDALHFNTG